MLHVANTNASRSRASSSVAATAHQLINRLAARLSFRCGILSPRILPSEGYIVNSIVWAVANNAFSLKSDKS